MSAETHRDCRTCRHNTYIDTPARDEFFHCRHPVTLALEAVSQPDHPRMVDWRTADVRMDEIHQFADCPAWEPVE